MDALRLTRITAGLVPEEPEVHGLVALMAFTAARFPARLRPDGTPILLADQDRTRWDRSLIRLGERSLHTAERLHAARAVPTAETLHTAQTPGTGSGPYTLQAAIAAVHGEAPTAAETDWEQIVVLYRMLLRIAPSPVVELNLAAETLNTAVVPVGDLVGRLPKRLTRGADKDSRAGNSSGQLH